MSTAELNESNRHQLLSTDRRRLLLEIIRERSSPLHLETLAETLAERESAPEPPSEDEIQRAELSLYHKHLPKMDDMGVIEYDRDTDIVQ